MPSLPDLFHAVIAEYEPRLRAITGARAAANPRGAEAWSPKQELGHLIDSAANNRVRFITAALAGEYAGPSYDGPGWVHLGGYSDLPWPDLVDLWRRVNFALGVVVERIPASRMSATCRIADYPPATLEFVIEDYVRHMRHHLDHIVASA